MLAQRGAGEAHSRMVVLRHGLDISATDCVEILEGQRRTRRSSSKPDRPNRLSVSVPGSVGQVRVAEIDASEVDCGDVCVTKGSTLHLCAFEARTGEVAPIEDGPRYIGLLQATTAKVRPGQIHL